MTGILILFHNPSNSGFASSRHEIAFTEMAYKLVGNYKNIHFAYTNLDNGRPPSLPKGIVNIIGFDASTNEEEILKRMQDYVEKNEINICFGFDLAVRKPALKYLRAGGIKYVISYIGAPMSSLNSGLKLLIKRLDVALSLHKPDHFIFQSEGMRETAVQGRGIPKKLTSIVLSGTDIDLYKPTDTKSWYAYDSFNIDRKRKIIFFSGNMAPRKGVDVIIKTAAELVNKRGIDDVHFLLVGNRWGQEKELINLVNNTDAENHITFGGYREDVPKILKSCYAGMIASNEWDSYPMSAIEMAATELPVLVSDIPGLREVVSTRTGFLFPVNDHEAASKIIIKLLRNPELKIEMGKAARNQVSNYQTVKHQIHGMEKVVRTVAKGHL